MGAEEIIPIVEQFGNKVLNASGLITNANDSSSLLYQFLIILLAAWFALCGYLLFSKPKLLEEWKIPNFVSISLIILLGIISYVTVFLGVYAILMLNYIVKVIFNLARPLDMKMPDFSIIVFLMIIYIVIFLRIIANIKKPKKTEEGNFVPYELRYLIPYTTHFLFGLLLIDFGLVLFTFPPNIVVYVTASIIIIFVILTFLDKKTLREISKKLDIRTWFKKIR